MGVLHDLVSLCLIDPGNFDIQCDSEIKPVITIRQEADLAGDFNVVVTHLVGLCPRYMDHGIFEASRITSSEELLGISRVALATEFLR